MTQFDHRFDSQIQKKEDLRFERQDVAEDYAFAQYRMYGAAQNVVPADEPKGFFRIIECETKLPQSVYFVNESVG